MMDRCVFKGKEKLQKLQENGNLGNNSGLEFFQSEDLWEDLLAQWGTRYISSMADVAAELLQYAFGTFH